MERCVQIEAYRAGVVLGCWDRACSKFLSDFSAEFPEDRQTEGYSNPWEVFISHPALLTETGIFLQHRTMHRAEQRMGAENGPLSWSAALNWALTCSLLHGE